MEGYIKKRQKKKKKKKKKNRILLKIYGMDFWFSQNYEII